MREKYILAIDQGTSGTKAIIFNSRGQIVARGEQELESSYPKKGFVEQDPEDIYQNVLQAVRQCISIYQRGVRTELDDIVSCGISNQRETIVLWDKDGTPLYNAIVWQCKRSVEICENIKGTTLETRYYNSNYTPFDGYRIKSTSDNKNENIINACKIHNNNDQCSTYVKKRHKRYQL